MTSLAGQCSAGRGMARLGAAGLCKARRGRGLVGGWSSPGFDSPAPTQGVAGPGRACLGAAWLGTAWPGKAGGGRVAHIRVRVPDAHARPGQAGLGSAGRGEAGGRAAGSHWGSRPQRPRAARPGEARRGKAWRGPARRGMAGNQQQLEGAAMFEVKGDRPQWRTVYEHISAMHIGDVIKHDELADLLPDAPETSIGSAFRRAVQECETDLKRTFANVRGVGYKMVDAKEHERLARGHHKRAKRQLKSARRKAVSADRSLLTREERARIDAVELNLSRQIEMTGRLEARVEKVETALQVARREQRTDSAELAERVDKLADLLAKHGIADKAAA